MSPYDYSHNIFNHIAIIRISIAVTNEANLFV